jgi:hypothetical protein
MNYLRLAQFSQVKTSSFVQSNVNKLFGKFQIHRQLQVSGLSKGKGYSLLEMLFLMLLLILESSGSVYAGISKLGKEKLKTPLNNLLNHEHYNWRRLLYSVAGRFAQLCPVQAEKISVLIIDDTSREKTGRKGENLAWFVDHCKQRYYMGFQVIMAVWSNGRSAIPLDFELKIGKSIIKHAARTHYHKGTHPEQRERMAKQKKVKIAIQFIKRAVQRRYKFRYLLWDSWFNCSESMRFVFSELKHKGIDLIAMLKRDGQKYLHQGQFHTIKELYRKAGKWTQHPNTEIKYKSLFVTILDKTTSPHPEEQTTLGQVKICFYKYPSSKHFKVIVSTDTELTEWEVLSIYLRRWAVEVVFKDLKQHFGYAMSKSSKYAPQIADLSIRCVFYIMFCYLQEGQPEKSKAQLLLEFYHEMQETWLDMFGYLFFYEKGKDFLNLALEMGYTSIVDVLKAYDYIFHRFMVESLEYDKIEEVDNPAFKRFAYCTAG